MEPEATEQQLPQLFLMSDAKAVQPVRVTLKQTCSVDNGGGTYLLLLEKKTWGCFQVMAHACSAAPLSPSLPHPPWYGPAGGTVSRPIVQCLRGDSHPMGSSRHWGF